MRKIKYEENEDFKNKQTEERNKFMSSVKEIFIAVAILVGGGFAIHKIHQKVRTMALHKVQQGLPPIGKFTEKLTGIKASSIEQGKTH